MLRCPDIRRLVQHTYNHNYLRAEYQHAVGSILMASRWQQIECDCDRYAPGKTLKLFPPQHPYLPKGCDGCEARTQFSYIRRDNYRDECLVCHNAREICLNNSIQRLNEWKQTIDARQGLSIT